MACLSYHASSITWAGKEYQREELLELRKQIVSGINNTDFGTEIDFNAMQYMNTMNLPAVDLQSARAQQVESIRKIFSPQPRAMNDHFIK